MTIDLALSDDQDLLVASFDSLLDKHCGPEVVRAAEPLGFHAPLWATLAELGPVQMALPEHAGGWGASMLDLCLVGESLGRRAAPVPLVETQVAARLLARLGSELLQPVLEEGAIATLALHGITDGTARLVPAGAVADLVVARAADEILCVRDAKPRQVPNHADMPLADVPVPGGTLASGGSAVAAFEMAVDEWLLLTASTLVGLSARALDLAVGYACEREAFGQPIGSFQGIAHPLADVATSLDGARLLVHEAAWSVDIGHEEAAERSCMAFAFAADVARKATYWGVHTLGGYGVMLEYDAQLYFRRARGWAGVFGDSEAAYRRVAGHRYRQRGVS